MNLRLCYTVLLATLTLGITKAESSQQAKPFTVPYSINFQEFPEASTLVSTGGSRSLPAQKQGRIAVDPPEWGLQPIFLMNRARVIIGIDVLFSSKTSLLFTQTNTAKAALTSTGPVFFLPNEQKIKLYQKLDTLEVFKKYLQAQQKAGGYANVPPETLSKAQATLAKMMLMELGNPASKQSSIPKPVDFTLVNRALQSYAEEVYKVALSYQAENNVRTLPTIDCSKGYKAGKYSTKAPNILFHCQILLGPGQHLKVIVTSPQTGGRSEVGS